MAERLRDRFGWGLCAELDCPDLPTRTALLWRMTLEGPSELRDPAALKEIASLVLGNVRRLQGAMTRVAAFSSMLSEPVTPALARRALEHHPPMTPGPPGRAAARCLPSVVAIQEAVCSVCGVSRAGPSLTKAQLPDLSCAAAGDVPDAPGNLAVARPDRSRVQPRPQHRPSRDPSRLQSSRAGLRDHRCSPPQPVNCCAATQTRQPAEPSTRPAQSPQSPSTAASPQPLAMSPLLHNHPPPSIHLRQIGRCKILQ